MDDSAPLSHQVSSPLLRACPGAAGCPVRAHSRPLPNGQKKDHGYSAASSLEAAHSHRDANGPSPAGPACRSPGRHHLCLAVLRQRGVLHADAGWRQPTVPARSRATALDTLAVLCLKDLQLRGLQSLVTVRLGRLASRRAGGGIVLWGQHGAGLEGVSGPRPSGAAGRGRAMAGGWSAAWP